MDPLPQFGSHAFIAYPTLEQSSSNGSNAPLELLNSSSWTYCGPLLSSASSLPPSFHTWSRTTFSSPIQSRLLPLLTFLQNFLTAAGAHHYWLTIRATKPTSEFDTVRWHTDDIFFDYEGEKSRQSPSPDRELIRNTPSRGYWKLATTLLGPSTLFLKDGVNARRVQREAKRAECEKMGDHTCTQFRCLGCLDAVEAVRQTLSQAFSGSEIESPDSGEIAFFRLGDEEGAVHSEPKCDTDRIFVNVVPGTEGELKDLMARWGMEFPRSWCFGIPIGFRDDDSMIDNNATASVCRGLFSSGQAVEVSGREYDWPHTTPSTMSLNLHDDYVDWLKRQGFIFREVFGQAGVDEKCFTDSSGY